MGSTLGPTAIVVKNVPDGLLNGQDRLDFFRHFGATDFRGMDKSFRMRNMIFLNFPSRQEALSALVRLQQLSFMGRRLKVEFATPNKDALSESRTLTDQTEDNLRGTSLIADLQKPEPIAPKLGIEYPPPPGLFYKYPPPTPEILTNIMHSIAAVPRLYTQVLHLMNKMNLPPPFGPVTAPPPAMKTNKAKNQKKRKARDALLASDESELESSDEDEGQKQTKRTKVLQQSQPQSKLKQQMPSHPESQQTSTISGNVIVDATSSFSEAAETSMFA
ncbi:RNA-binding region-containing protein 3 [Quaeritorhiza haematococci]|nr:RNA-binding region-containing protein 3 [Quaeritorhiza haematococci]